MTPTQVVFTTDDFGRMSSTNAAVIHPQREGALTSASLMVTGDAFTEAVRLAQDHPSRLWRSRKKCLPARGWTLMVRPRANLDQTGLRQLPTIALSG